jgi:hypothetical protein
MRRIVRVRPLPGLAVQDRLTDDTVRTIDLTPFLWGQVFETIASDRALFEQMYVDQISRTITWPNGADIDPDVLLGEAAPATADR